MDAVNGSHEMREWLRARGHQVADRGRISGAKAEEYYGAFPDRRPPDSLRPLPGPDDDIDEYEDLGDFTVEPAGIPAIGADSDADGFTGPQPGNGRGPAPEGVSVDPGPAHGGKGWRRAGKTGAGAARGKPPRVTAGVRADIEAKISLPLEVTGRVWQARDPVCGTVFVEQRPQIAEALCEIVCRSPDLLAWFAGSGGQFMLWFNLLMACLPVGSVLMAHHVYHTVEASDGEEQAPDYTRYAA